MTVTESRFTVLRREMLQTFVLALPLILGHVATGMIGFVDSVLAGRHSANTLAAVAVGTAIWSAVTIVLVGILLAVPPSVSQLMGAGKRHEVPALFRQTLWLALGLAAILVCFMFASHHLLAPMGITPEIQPAAKSFLTGLKWGVPALALYLAMRYFSEGLHWTLPTMVLGLGGLLVLAPLGYVLMFGHAGFPEMGAAGLGYATSIMLWLQAISFAIYLSRSQRFADLALFSRWDWPHWPTIKSLLALGLPIGVTVMMEGGLFIATALLIGRLGEVPAAAHQIAINIGVITFMAALALAEATTVRVGHAVGRGSMSGLRRAIAAGFTLVVLIQLCTAIAIFLGNQAIPSIYTQDVAVITLAATLLLFTAAFQLSDGLQVVAGAALRGLKDARIPMLLAALAYWGIGMPLGAGLGLGLGWGAQGMWAGLVTGLTVAAILLGLRLRYSLRKLATHPSMIKNLTES